MQSTHSLLSVLNCDRLTATNDTLFSAEGDFQTLRPLLRSFSLAADLLSALAARHRMVGDDCVVSVLRVMLWPDRPTTLAARLCVVHLQAAFVHAREIPFIEEMFLHRPLNRESHAGQVAISRILVDLDILAKGDRNATASHLNEEVFVLEERT